MFFSIALEEKHAIFKPKAHTVKQINDLVHRKTKIDLKCLSMSFASLHSVAFLQCILLLTLEEQCSNLSSFSVLLIN